jgi:hypothetical protein
MRVEGSAVGLVAVLLFFANAAAYGADLCPRDIETEQIVKSPRNGYDVQSDAMGASRLTFVEFFDVPPAQLASLVPDNETSRSARWNFADQNQHGGNWIGCHYSRTRLVMLKKLPTGTRSCTVTYLDAKNGLIEGARQIMSIKCEEGSH